VSGTGFVNLFESLFSGKSNYNLIH